MVDSLDYTAKIIDDFNSMSPFVNELDIPTIPAINRRIYDDVIVPNLIRCGAIPKNKLKLNKIYIGSSKESKEAIWKGTYFAYLIDKWGTKMIKKVSHFEDYNSRDIFIPIKQIE